MKSFKLIYFEGCPNAKKAIGLLDAIGLSFHEIKQDQLPDGDPLQSYVSPSLLFNDQIVFGEKTGSSSSGCSLDIPNEAELRERLSKLSLSLNLQPRKGSDLLSIVGSFGSAITVGLCPVCIPAIGAFLSAIGLGFLASESVLQPLLILFLGIALFGFLWSYFKEHQRLSPFILGLLTAVGIYTSRYVYLGAEINGLLMYGSIAGLILVSLWNLRLKKKSRCGACVK